MSAPVTQWFGMDTPPVRIGNYQRDYRTTEATACPDYWDGEKFMLCSHSGEIIGIALDPLNWRGLASPPSTESTK